MDEMDELVLYSLLRLVKEGLVEMDFDEDGEPVFSLTEKGVKEAEEILKRRGNL